MTQQRIPADIQARAATQGAVPYTSPEGGAYLVVQCDQRLRVFINQCPHRRLPLDHGGRVVFTTDRRRLVCMNHGAKFDPLTGQCVAGPCVGKTLQRVPALEEPAGA